MTEPILGLRTAIYKVADLEEAVTWYTGAFGSEPYFNDSVYAGFNIAGYELGLLHDTALAGAGPARLVAYWGVDDMERAVAYFLSCGATLVEPPVNVGGDIVVASLNDPWGNTIGLIRNPGFAPN